MSQRRRYFLIPLAATLLVAADDPSWRSKPADKWTEDDAKQLLTGSPWVWNTQLQRIPDIPVAARRDGGDWDGGIGPGIGLAGVGLFGSRRMQEAIVRAHARPDPGTVLVRWESALPVHAAELRLTETEALPAEPPAWQTEFYAIAVYNVPVPSQWNPRELKGIAFLKRYQKKDFKPSRVDILRHEDGLASVVYFFRRSEEITKKDANILFQAQIGRVFVAQYFDLGQMEFRGELEL